MLSTAHGREYVSISHLLYLVYFEYVALYKNLYLQEVG